MMSSKTKAQNRLSGPKFALFILFLDLTVASTIGQQTGGSFISQRPFFSSNCTRCSIWQGDDCFEYKPCVFCNNTVECTEPLFCQDNVCTLDPLLGGGVRRDPLGRIIALSLLGIFLLGIFTLCLRICASTCCQEGRRCCVIQCAISVQCCCEWKAGRLRILPPPGNAVEPSSGQHRRESLCPPPPPAYGEIYPEQENQAANPPSEGVAQTPVVPEPSEETPSRSNNFLRWFRPFSDTYQADNLTMTPCRHTEQDHCATAHESGSQSQGWFRRAATLVAGPGRSRHHCHHHRHRNQHSAETPWTTSQSLNLHHTQTLGIPEPTLEAVLPTAEVVRYNYQEELQLTSQHPVSVQQFDTRQSSRISDFDTDLEETFSENLNSAINSLLDFQIYDVDEQSFGLSQTSGFNSGMTSYPTRLGRDESGNTRTYTETASRKTGITNSSTINSRQGITSSSLNQIYSTGEDLALSSDSSHPQSGQQNPRSVQTASSSAHSRMSRNNVYRFQSRQNNSRLLEHCNASIDQLSCSYGQDVNNQSLHFQSLNQEEHHQTRQASAISARQGAPSRDINLPQSVHEGDISSYPKHSNSVQGSHSHSRMSGQRSGHLQRHLSESEALSASLLQKALSRQGATSSANNLARVQRSQSSTDYYQAMREATGSPQDYLSKSGGFWSPDRSGPDPSRPTSTTVVTDVQRGQSFIV